MKSLILFVALMITSGAFAQERICPEPLTPHTTSRVTVLGITVTEATGVSTLGMEWDIVYSDNRHEVGYYYDIAGDFTVTNPTANALIMRYHIVVPLYYTPYAPISTQNLCYEAVTHELVFRIEQVVQPGETVVINFEASADFGSPYDGADFNGDYVVDGVDLGLLYSAWGSDDPRYDLNGDGVVDGEDLGILLENWSDSNG